ALKISAASGPVVGTDQRTFQVGVIVQPSDPDIKVIQITEVVFDTTTGNVDPDPQNKLDGSTIKLKPNKQMVVPFNVTPTKKGSYDLTILPKQGTTLNGWTLEIIDTQNPLVVANDNDQTAKLMQIGITSS